MNDKREAMERQYGDPVDDRISIAELIAWLRQQQIPARVAHDNSTKDLQQGFYAGRFDAFESTIMHLEEKLDA